MALPESVKVRDFRPVSSNSFRHFFVKSNAILKPLRIGQVILVLFKARG